MDTIDSVSTTMLCAQKTALRALTHPRKTCHTSEAAAYRGKEREKMGIQIEAGKTYKTEGGMVVGPMRLIPRGWGYEEARWKWTDLTHKPETHTERARLWDADGDAGQCVDWQSYRIVSEVTAPALMIEAGRYYRTRDGRKVGPMEAMTSGDASFYAEGLGLYRDDGRFGYDKITATDLDLIAEWQADTEEPQYVYTHLDDTGLDHASIASFADTPHSHLAEAAIGFIRQGNYSAALETLTILRDEA